MDWLKQIAPTIATAMGGPLAGMAVSAISKAIGVDPDKVGDLISNNKLTAEQIAQVKIAEIELQKQAQELGLNFEKLEVEDRKSAREMQATTRSMMPPLLAGAVTLGFFGHGDDVLQPDRQQQPGHPDDAGQSGHGLDGHHCILLWLQRRLTGQD